MKPELRKPWRISVAIVLRASGVACGVRREVQSISWAGVGENVEEGARGVLDGGGVCDEGGEWALQV